MSTVITGAATTGLVLGTATVPAAGDFVTGAGLQTPVQAVENDIMNLREHVFPDGNKAIVRWLEVEPFWFNAATWNFDSTTGLWQDAGAGNGMFFPMPAPHNSLLVAINARILPNGGHGALPANKPLLDFWELNVSTNTPTKIATVNDAPASVVAYEAAHTFGLTPSGTNAAWASTTAYSYGDFRTNGGTLYMCTFGGTSAGAGGPSGSGPNILDGTAVWAYAHGVNSYVVDRAVNRYWIRFYSESGANLVNGLILIGLQIGFYVIEQGH